jgi:hypothetical protein
MPIPGNQLPSHNDEAMAQLRRLAPEGSKLYVITRDHTRNGTTYLDVYAINRDDGVPVYLSRLIHSVCSQFPMNERRECLAVPGYGYSKQDAVISALSSKLYGRPNAIRYERL